MRIVYITLNANLVLMIEKKVSKIANLFKNVNFASACSEAYKVANFNRFRFGLFVGGLLITRRKSFNSKKVRRWKIQKFQPKYVHNPSTFSTPSLSPQMKRCKKELHEICFMFNVLCVCVCMGCGRPKFNFQVKFHLRFPQQSYNQFLLADSLRSTLYLAIYFAFMGKQMTTFICPERICTELCFCQIVDTVSRSLTCWRTLKCPFIDFKSFDFFFKLIKKY